MVLLWYYNGNIMVLSSEEKRWQDGFSTKGKTWRIKRKNEFLRKNLAVSDVLCIFASDGIYGIKLKTKILLQFMRKYLLLIFFALFSFSAIHADDDIKWTLENGTLTISETDMPDYIRGVTGEDLEDTITAPWFPQRDKIKKVVIEDGVTRIGRYAFSFCTSLKSITIPNSVTSIGEDAFLFCSSLTSITIPNSVTSIGEGAFYGCKSLTSITISNSVTSIKFHTFCLCESLTSVTIPNSVTSIGESAFSDCVSLTSVTIPNSVTAIGENAFYECSDLTSITFERSTPPDFVEGVICDEGVFSGVNKSIPVYVPVNSIKAYRKLLKRYFKKSSIQALQR